MFHVILWSFLFSVTTSVSILFLGNRDLIGGQMSLLRMFHIIFDWRFIIGAILAFAARILFILTNNALLKIPGLAESATSITALINSCAIILVIIANYFFLGERLSLSQGVGAFLVMTGIYFLVK